MTQDEALAILKTGASVFLTGAPGSGKTHTVNRFAAWLRARRIDRAMTASTGIAATQANGITVHAWSGIGVRQNLGPSDLERIDNNARLARRIQKASVLIIDEISMLSAQTLNLVDTVCRHVRDTLTPFGGLQVVLVGDFFQLPPVVSRRHDAGALPFADDEPLAQFAYASSAWRDLDPTVCYLGEQHRQRDRAFLDLLGAIRGNAIGPAHRSTLAGRMLAGRALPPGCTRLFTHNVAVDRINDQELAKVPGKERVFTMGSTGPEPLVEGLRRGCMSPPRLALKEGAIVMFTRNDPAGRYVNGTLGVIADFDDDTGHPLVETRRGKTITAEPVQWSIEEGGRTRASVTQIPLRLAWAITVHKSQGMSLDAAVIDLSRAFEYGQGYVALSRLRTLQGLHLLGLNERALMVHPLSVEKDCEFRAASDRARASLDQTGQSALAAQQERLAKSAGALRRRAPRRRGTQ